jgi:hypothetical protein
MLSVTVPHSVAHAAAGPAPTWQAWALSVDFPQQTPHVLYTVYTGRNTPDPTVLSSITEDISKSCVIESPTKTLAYDGTSAIFDGNSYIRCTVPSWHSKLAVLAPGLPGANKGSITCTAGLAPAWGAADVKLDKVSSANPIIDARELGITFSLPSDGVNVRTRLALSSRTYTSPTWPIDTTDGNRMLIGMHGPGIVAVAGHFGWLKFLGTGWDTYFTNNVTGARTGSWVESPIATWRTTAVPYTLKTKNATVYIGHDSVTGANLRGKLIKGEGDPGCFSD